MGSRGSVIPLFLEKAKKGILPITDPKMTRFNITLEKAAELLEIKDKVIFVGKVSNDLIPAYLNSSDIFVRASRSEGLGISFIEAMAAGVPVIGPNVGGIPDLISDGKTGLLCKPEDPADLANKISALVSKPELASKIVKQSKQMVEDNFNWDKISSQINKSFSTLVKQ